MKVQSSHDVVMERSRRAWELKGQGKSNAEISKELGVSTGALHYYLYTTGKELKQTKRHRGVVSVLGSPTMNGKVHHEWFVAGWIASYATTNHLDVAGLLVDVDDVLKGKAHE